MPIWSRRESRADLWPDVVADVVGGVTTFVTMAYIVVVNPQVLASPGTGMSFAGVMTATVLLAFGMTLLMGLYAKLPFGVAPGMGINAFFAYSLILGRKIPWPEALGIVFWAGVVFLLLSLTNVRLGIARAIPEGLRGAAGVGIGLFLAFIGLKNAGLVAADPATLVKLGHLDGKVLLSVAGLALTAWLMGRGGRTQPLAFLAGIVAVTAAAWGLGYVEPPPTVFSRPDFSSVFLKLDVVGSLKLAFLPAMLAVAFTDLFDSLSTFVGVARASGLVDAAGEPLRLRQGLVVDAVATLAAGLVGTSSGTAFIESVAGIEAGGRTGRAAVVTALCFLPCLFLAPLAGVVPPYATAPTLILVGSLMFRSVSGLRFDKVEDALPQFLIIVLIPLTFSITQGLLWGFLAHVVLYLARGRRVSGGMLGIGALSAALLALENAPL